MDGVEVLNEVTSNQVIARFGTLADPGEDRTAEIIAALHRNGTCYPSPSAWRGRPVMRVSICNWATSTADIDHSLAAIAALLSATGRRS